jgi:RNA polymerase sigma factor (sigma-70 family)
VPVSAIPLSTRRFDRRRVEPSETVLREEIAGSDGTSGRGQASGSIVQNRDERTLFDEIFLPHMAEAYRLAQWLTGSASDAEDVVQDAALRAFRGIRSFGAVNARAWSLSIVRNTAYSWLTKNRSKKFVSAEELSPAEQLQVEQENVHGARAETPEDVMLLKADAADVEKALARLPTAFREVIVLREMNQMNYRDIAEITNTPIGTVMSRLSRARQLLVELLGDRKS